MYRVRKEKHIYIYKGSWDKFWQKKEYQSIRRGCCEGSRPLPHTPTPPTHLLLLSQVIPP